MSWVQDQDEVFIRKYLRNEIEKHFNDELQKAITMTNWTDGCEYLKKSVKWNALVRGILKDNEKNGKRNDILVEDDLGNFLTRRTPSRQYLGQLAEKINNFQDSSMYEEELLQLYASDCLFTDHWFLFFKGLCSIIVNPKSKKYTDACSLLGCILEQAAPRQASSLYVSLVSEAFTICTLPDHKRAQVNGKKLFVALSNFLASNSFAQLILNCDASMTCKLCQATLKLFTTESEHGFESAWHLFIENQRGKHGQWIKTFLRCSPDPKAVADVIVNSGFASFSIDALHHLIFSQTSTTFDFAHLAELVSICSSLLHIPAARYRLALIGTRHEPQQLGWKLVGGLCIFEGPCPIVFDYESWQDRSDMNDTEDSTPVYVHGSKASATVWTALRCLERISCGAFPKRIPKVFEELWQTILIDADKAVAAILTSMVIPCIEDSINALTTAASLTIAKDGDNQRVASLLNLLECCFYERSFEETALANTELAVCDMCDQYKEHPSIQGFIVFLLDKVPFLFPKLRSIACDMKSIPLELCSVVAGCEMVIQRQVPLQWNIHNSSGIKALTNCFIFHEYDPILKISGVTTEIIKNPHCRLDKDCQTYLFMVLLSSPLGIEILNVFEDSIKTMDTEVLLYGLFFASMSVHMPHCRIAPLVRHTLEKLDREYEYELSYLLSRLRHIEESQHSENRIYGDKPEIPAWVENMIALTKSESEFLEQDLGTRFDFKSIVERVERAVYTHPEHARLRVICTLPIHIFVSLCLGGNRSKEYVAFQLRVYEHIPGADPAMFVLGSMHANFDEIHKMIILSQSRVALMESMANMDFWDMEKSREIVHRCNGTAYQSKIFTVKKCI